MNSQKEKVVDFLKGYAVDHEGIDMDSFYSIFLDEMEKGLAGEESSLNMIPTYIEADKEIPVNEPVIVLDAGGTNDINNFLLYPLL